MLQVMLRNNENKHLPRKQLSSLQELHCQQSQSHLFCQHSTHSFPVEYNSPDLQCFYPLWIKYLHVMIHMRAIYIFWSLISRVKHTGVFHKSTDVSKLGADKKTASPFVWRVNIKEVPRSINSVCSEGWSIITTHFQSLWVFGEVIRHNPWHAAGLWVWSRQDARISPSHFHLWHEGGKNQQGCSQLHPTEAARPTHTFHFSCSKLKSRGISPEMLE